MEWNRYNLQQNLRQPSLIDLSIWFNLYAEVCSDLPSSNQQAFSAHRPNNQNISNAQRSQYIGATKAFLPGNRTCPYLGLSLRPVGQMDATGNITLYYNTARTTTQATRQAARTLQLGILNDRMMQRIDAPPAQKDGYRPAIFRYCQ